MLVSKNASNPKIRQLQEEFNLFCYPWPRLLGTDRQKWQQVAKLVDRTARADHKRECTGLAPDGRSNLGNTPFERCHYSHRGSVERALVRLLEQGIPSFLCEGKSSLLD